MNPEDIRAPFLRKEEVWAIVEKLRVDYSVVDDLPVNVLDLAEFDLGLDLVPAYALTEECDTDAVLLGDLKTILVDKRSFTNPRQYRLRFSVAHEIGHLILHARLYEGIKHKDAKAWLNFMSRLPEKEYGWIEWQAYEFAGRLLVPLPALNESLISAVEKARAAGVQTSFLKDQSTLDLVSRFIQRRFDVSAGVIARRLQNEELWPPNF
jgi:hypothetical protein